MNTIKEKRNSVSQTRDIAKLKSDINKIKSRVNTVFLENEDWIKRIAEARIELKSLKEKLNK